MPANKNTNPLARYSPRLAPCAENCEPHIEMHESNSGAYVLWDNLRVALGMNESWPLTDVLGKLIEATEHLLRNHNCDTDGYEEFRAACVRGKEILRTIQPEQAANSVLAPSFPQAAPAAERALASAHSQLSPPARGRDTRPQVQALFSSLKQALPQLKALLVECRTEYAEDPIYRFYHHSFKVYGLQQKTLTVFEALRSLAPQRKLHSFFEKIIKDGTGKHFELEHNQRWLLETRPILEAFFHARYFLEIAVRYGDELTEPPLLLPSGWAAFLYLFNLR